MRVKYRGALRRWHTDTGGGSGGPIFFQDFCGGSSYKWLTWIYLVDLKHCLLLASTSSTSVPDALQNKGGSTVATPLKANASPSKKSVSLFDQMSGDMKGNLTTMNSMYSNANVYFAALAKTATQKSELEEQKSELEKPSVNQYIAKLEQLQGTKSCC